MEKTIIKKIQDGDDKAFEILYHQYANYALRVGFAVTRNIANSADAVQETFIRVYRNIDKFDINKPFKPWFYKILINECRRLMSSSTAALPLDENIGNNSQLSKEDDHKFQEYELLYKAIDELDDINRIPIILKYLQDFSEKEIAKILDLNINTVKSRLYKGRQQLKKILVDFEGRMIANE